MTSATRFCANAELTLQTSASAMMSANSERILNPLQDDLIVPDYLGCSMPHIAACGM